VLLQLSITIMGLQGRPRRMVGSCWCCIHACFCCDLWTCTCDWWSRVSASLAGFVAVHSLVTDSFNCIVLTFFYTGQCSSLTSIACYMPVTHSSFSGLAELQLARLSSKIQLTFWNMSMYHLPWATAGMCKVVSLWSLNSWHPSIC